MQLLRLLVQLGEKGGRDECQREERREESAGLSRRERGSGGLGWILWLRVIQLIKGAPQGASRPLMGAGELLSGHVSTLTHALVPERTTTRRADPDLLVCG